VFPHFLKRLSDHYDKMRGSHGLEWFQNLASQHAVGGMGMHANGALQSNENGQVVQMLEGSKHGASSSPSAEVFWNDPHFAVRIAWLRRPGDRAALEAGIELDSPDLLEAMR